jgi:hypothetical protein
MTVSAKDIMPGSDHDFLTDFALLLLILNGVLFLLLSLRYQKKSPTRRPGCGAL